MRYDSLSLYVSGRSLNKFSSPPSPYVELHRRVSTLSRNTMQTRATTQFSTYPIHVLFVSFGANTQYDLATQPRNDTYICKRSSAKRRQRAHRQRASHSKHTRSIKKHSQPNNISTNRMKQFASYR